MRWQMVLNLNVLFPILVLRPKLKSHPFPSLIRVNERASHRRFGAFLQEAEVLGVGE